MSLQFVSYLAMIIAPAITAAARPALTFWAIQVIVAVLGHQGWATPPGFLSWLLSVPALVVGAVFAVVEAASRHDPDIEAFLRELWLDRLIGVVGASSSALLFVSLDLPAEGAAELVPHVGAANDLLRATGQAAASSHPLAVQIGVVGVALAINGGLVWLRARILGFFYEFALGSAWARVETGGIFVLLLTLPVLPLFALSVMVFMVIGFVGLGLVALLVHRWSDWRGRVSCSSCDYRLRPEALACPNCGAARTPTVVVGQPRAPRPA